MKKLIIVCLLVAIGAVGMIGKSNADGTCITQGRIICGANTNNAPNPPPNQPWGQQNPNYQGYHPHHYNNGGSSFGLNIYTQPNYGGSYYDDPGYYGDDPYTYDDPPPVYRSYSSNRCNAWADRLRGLGFRNVRANDCVGSSYVYRATKAGRPVWVTVGARSGSVIRVANAY